MSLQLFINQLGEILAIFSKQIVLNAQTLAVSQPSNESSEIIRNFIVLFDGFNIIAWVSLIIRQIICDRFEIPSSLNNDCFLIFLKRPIISQVCRKHDVLMIQKDSPPENSPEPHERSFENSNKCNGFGIFNLFVQLILDILRGNTLSDLFALFECTCKRNK